MDEGIHQVACVLHALQASTKLLEDHYSGLNHKAEQVDGELMLPYFQEFIVNGKAYKLKYTKFMAMDRPSRAVFRASIGSEDQAGGSDVVVKFAHSYCRPTHKLLAGISLAPRLQYCEKVDSIGMYIVVMDLAAEMDIGVSFQDQSISSKLRKAIQALHDVGFVHGDLQEPNILVTDNGDMKIIDFDWCGKEREVYYPSDINLGISWDPEVKRGGLIKKDHDRWMYSKLTGLKWPEGEA